MFIYFLAAPLLTYSWLLILAATIPAIILMVKVYQSDRLEPESPALLWKMMTGGFLAAIVAGLIEAATTGILSQFMPSTSLAYKLILYFGIVAFSEEGMKYYFLQKRSWYSPEFNCQYDGVVYAVFVALGFALFENISYVFSYGFSTALIRAVTAIPGHAAFGVFMGVFYGQARGHSYLGNTIKTKSYQVLAVLMPALVHGSYDYVATLDSLKGQLIFLIFIVLLFAVAFRLVNVLAKNDRYFNIVRRRMRH